MSSQVPVWFWRRMSRLVADQESRGGAGDSGAGETESVMRMNLAEGCRAVNAAPWRAEREVRGRRERRDLKFEVPEPRTSDIEHSRLACPASLACLARLGRRVVLVGCFSV